MYVSKGFVKNGDNNGVIIKRIIIIKIKTPPVIEINKN